jgi:hypothetical protein
MDAEKMEEVGIIPTGALSAAFERAFLVGICFFGRITGNGWRSPETVGERIGARGERGSDRRKIGVPGAK